MEIPLRTECRARAKRTTSTRHNDALRMSLTAYICGFLIGLTGVGTIFLLPHIGFGEAETALLLYRGADVSGGNVFSRGTDHYWRKLGLYWLRALCLALGSLLIIPAFILPYSYCLAPYLMMDQPTLKPAEALRMSRMMMKGRKADRFVLDLSFIGWFILSGLTCGILGLVYVFPYYDIADAGFYEEVKRARTGASDAFDDPTLTSTEAAVKHGSLLGTAGAFSGARFPIPDDKDVLIGRDPSKCQIVLGAEAQKVSRVHCSVRFNAREGCYYVTDLSSNGTYRTSGARLPRGQMQMLSRGERIRLDPAGGAAFLLE